MIGVPVSYVIVDSLEFVDVTRRHVRPMVQFFPERWTLIYSVLDSGSRIYRRVTPPTRTESSSQDNQLAPRG